MIGTAVQYGLLEAATPEALADLNRLIAQLSRTPRAMDMVYLERVLAAPGVLVVTRHHGRIVGCAQVSFVPLMTKLKAWVDELVVDVDYRGQGIARRLMELAIEQARLAGCRHVNLISGHDRGARVLYESLGFEERASAQYRLVLS